MLGHEHGDLFAFLFLIIAFLHVNFRLLFIVVVDGHLILIVNARFSGLVRLDNVEDLRHDLVIAVDRLLLLIVFLPFVFILNNKKTQRDKC